MRLVKRRRESLRENPFSASLWSRPGIFSPKGRQSNETKQWSGTPWQVSCGRRSHLNDRITLDMRAAEKIWWETQRSKNQRQTNTKRVELPKTFVNVPHNRTHGPKVFLRPNFSRSKGRWRMLLLGDRVRRVITSRGITPTNVGLIPRLHPRIRPNEKSKKKKKKGTKNKKKRE